MAEAISVDRQMNIVTNKARLNFMASPSEISVAVGRRLRQARGCNPVGRLWRRRQFYTIRRYNKAAFTFSNREENHSQSARRFFLSLRVSSPTFMDVYLMR